jgi:hypothetical protein
MGGTIDEPDSGGELRAIGRDLEELRDRLGEAAARFERRGRGPDDAGASWAAAVTRRHLWALAGELLGMQERLLMLGADVARARSAGGRFRAAMPAPAAAEALGVIQCVIADRLDPAIDALVSLCRQRTVEEEVHDEPDL